MCARRFLMVILVLTLIVVAGAFAIFQFGGNVLLKSATPKGHFEAAEAGAGPDYRNDDAWLTRPGVDWPDDPTQWKPTEATLPESGSRVQANLGAGLGYSLVYGRFSFTPSVSGWARLRKSELTLNDEPLWTTPDVFGGLRLEIAYGFGRSLD